MLARHRPSVPWLVVILIVACLGPVLVHGAVGPGPGGDSVRLANASRDEASSTDSSEPVEVTTTVSREGGDGDGGGGEAPETTTTEAPATTTTEAPATTTTEAPETTTTTEAPTSTTTVPGDEPTPADEVLALVNEARAAAAAPCPPLEVDPALQGAAEAHTDDMAARQYLDHVTPEGQDPKARAVAQGYTGTAVGENIAQGYPDAQAVVDAWMASEGHRANIENCDYTVTGVGVNANGWYWTQVFGL